MTRWRCREAVALKRYRSHPMMLIGDQRLSYPSYRDFDHSAIGGVCLPLAAPSLHPSRWSSVPSRSVGKHARPLNPRSNCCRCNRYCFHRRLVAARKQSAVFRSIAAAELNNPTNNVAGRFNDIAKGTTLTEENKPLDTLFFICAGHVKVTIAGRGVAHLEKGNFVGEIAFLTEKPATATVVAEDSVRALVFERAELNRFFRSEAEVAGPSRKRSD